VLSTLLGLVDNDDGVRGLHKLYRLPPGEFITLLVNDVALLLLLAAGEVLAEGVNVDDENLNRVCWWQTAEACSPSSRRKQRLELDVVVDRTEVIAGDVDVLEHPFADWQRWVRR